MMKKLLSILLALAMLCSLTVPALAAAPEADLDPPLWNMLGYESYDDLLESSYEWTEEEYAATVAYILDFMSARPEETAQFRANAYRYFAKNDSYGCSSPEEFMDLWKETEEQFITEMAVRQIMDLRDAEEAASQWAQTCARQPERTALFLAQLDGWFAEEFWYYASLEEFCASYTCVEEAYLVLFDWWNWDYEQELSQTQERNAFITEHGGVPGQINLMVNGKFLASPAERPVYVENGITYADAGALSKALGIDAAANEAGYAPVRATAEAGGCQVYWDGTFNAAVVLDPAALAEEIDKGFTVINRLLAQQTPTEQKYQLSGAASADFTVFNSLDGDQTGKLSCSYDVIHSPSGSAGTMEYDFTPLWDLLQGYIAMPLAEDGDDSSYAQQAKVLMSGQAEIRVDAENGMAYFYLPALAPNAWFSLSLEGLNLDELTAAGEALSSIGQMICVSALDGYGDPVRFYDDALDLAAQAAALLGDEKFVRDGDAQVLTLGKEDIYTAMEAEDDQLSKFAFTLRLFDNGSAEYELECRMTSAGTGYMSGDILELTASGSQKDGTTVTTVGFHVRNAFQMTVRREERVSAAQSGPALTPPEGALILDMENLDGLGV